MKIPILKLAFIKPFVVDSIHNNETWFIGEKNYSILIIRPLKNKKILIKHNKIIKETVNKMRQKKNLRKKKKKLLR